MKKKLMGILAAAIAVVTCAGCSAQTQPIAEANAALQEQTETQPEKTETAAPEEAGADGNAAPESTGEVQAGEMVVGKGKSIVGNEIELELANPPFDMGKDGAAETAGGDEPYVDIVVSENVGPEPVAGLAPGEQDVAFGIVENGGTTLK